MSKNYSQTPDAATGKTALINYLMNIDSRPHWVDEESFDFDDRWDFLEITLNEIIHIKLTFDPRCRCSDTTSIDEDYGLGINDLMYAYDVMYNRDEIIALAIEAGFNKQYICNNVVAKIREYVKNYDGIMVDYDGSSACIHMGWDSFTDAEKDYAMDYEFILKNNMEYYLKKDTITVKEMLVDENGISVYVECK